MDLKVEQYSIQKENWPKSGKHILAQFNDKYVVVYQAYRPEIGLHATKHQYFGGAFSYARMSWIKPNFLWMMYRSGWETKEGQEVTLAIYLKRDYFDSILRNAFPSTNVYKMPQIEWKSIIQTTNVRLQWDPDHDPDGKPQSRRAIQLGLKNESLFPFQGDGIIKIEDISTFVNEQRAILKSGDKNKLLIPKESIYEVSPEIKKILIM